MFALSAIGQLSTTSISCVILFLLFSRLNEVDIRGSFVPPKKEIIIGSGNNLAQRTQKFILSEAKRGYKIKLLRRIICGANYPEGARTARIARSATKRASPFWS